MGVRRADWAAQVPWTGIQGIPASLGGSAGTITIDDVSGLRAALIALASAVTHPPSVSWSDITGKPTFGSAAYSNVSDFITPSQLTTVLLGYPTNAQAMTISLTRSFCKC